MRGRVVWRELDDPDGDADRHLVLLSRFRLRIVKLMPGRDYDRTIPAIGDTVEAVGFTSIGASGHREIYTEQLRR